MLNSSVNRTPVPAVIATDYRGVKPDGADYEVPVVPVEIMESHV